MTGSEPACPQVAIRLLGGVSLRVDCREVELGGDRIRSLLAILAMAAGGSVPTGVLVDRIWGEAQPANAGASLHTLMNRLRRVIGADLVTTGPAGYSLQIDPDQVDALLFGRLLRDAAQPTDPAEEHQAITRALKLWSGRPFEGISSEWLESSEAPRLVEQYLAAVERRIDLQRGDDLYGEVLVELRELTAAHPLRESLWVRLLRLLAQSGRTAEALELYESVRLRIADELGVDPGGELRGVHAELLAGDAPPPPRRIAPSQLPADVPGFTGRKEVLTELDKAFAARGPETVVTLVLHGPGGVGKTSLAVHWSHRVASEFPDGTLFADLGGYGPGEPVDPAVAAGFLLHALGVPAGQIPAGVDGRSALLRSTLAGQRVLLVLDNALNADQVRPLLPGTGAVVLITSRSRLRGLVAREGARQIPVEQLSVADARTLLTGRIGLPEVGGAKAIDQLADSCNHLPLALVIAAEQIARRSGAGLADLVSELQEHQLDAFDAGDDPATDLRAVFSWSYRALEPEAARFFRMLGLYPGRRFAPAAVAALAGLDERTATKLLRRLTDLHLVDESSPNRFQLHDLLRAYAAEQLRETESAQEVDAAWERMLDWAAQSAAASRRILGEPQRIHYLGPPLDGTVPMTFKDRPSAISWFDSELRALMAMVTASAKAGHHRQSAALALHLWAPLARLVSPEESIAIQQGAAESGRLAGRPLMEALAWNQLGTSFGEGGDLARAEEALLRSLKLFQEIDDESGESVVRGNLGFLYDLLGDHDQAIEQVEAALAIGRRQQDANAIAHQLNNLAIIYLALGRYDEAVVTATEAFEQSRDVPEDRVRAYTHDTLGQAVASRGEVDRAAVHFEASVAINLTLGQPAPAARGLIRLGKAYLSAGNEAAARTAWERSLAMVDEYGATRLGEAYSEALELIAELDRPAR